MEFAVGQRWRTRDGCEVTIHQVIKGMDYPVATSVGTHTSSGFILNETNPSPNDLVTLLSEPAAVAADPGHAIEQSFAAFDKTVGDINSDAKGSGARYNNGKAPFELIPLALIAEFYIAQADEPTPEMLALRALGAFQARGSEGRAHLIEALHHLGEAGWEECAQVFDYGRAKYAAWNWAKGMAWSVPIACAARHLLAKIRGEDIDPESQRPHRGHSYCNIVMLLTYEATFPEGDDRAAKGLL